MISEKKKPLTKKQKLERLRELRDFIQEISDESQPIYDITSYYEDERFKQLRELGIDDNNLEKEIGGIPYIMETADSLLEDIDEEIEELENSEAEDDDDEET